MKQNKINITTQMISVLFFLLFTAQVSAATVILKDGRSFEGEIKSQDAEKIILDMNGLEMTLPIEQVSSIDLSSSVKKAVPAKEVATEKQLTTGSATIAAGSAVRVKISEGFNSRHNKTGQRFTAVLESNLVSGGVIVAAKGSPVYGVLTEVKKAGRIAGSASIHFELTEISIDGTMHVVKTQRLGGKGENTAKSTLGKTARAAAIGGLIDGSSGAKTGAKVGAGVSLLTKGNDIEVPKGEILDFILIAPFTPQ